MPYGLVSAPFVFQDFMYEVLREFLHKFVLFYIDNILIYSRSLYFIHSPPCSTANPSLCPGPPRQTKPSSNWSWHPAVQNSWYILIRPNPSLLKLTLPPVLEQCFRSRGCLLSYTHVPSSHTKPSREKLRHQKLRAPRHKISTWEMDAKAWRGMSSIYWLIILKYLQYLCGVEWSWSGPDHTLELHPWGDCMAWNGMCSSLGVESMGWTQLTAQWLKCRIPIQDRFSDVLTPSTIKMEVKQSVIYII